MKKKINLYKLIAILSVFGIFLLEADLFYLTTNNALKVLLSCVTLITCVLLLIKCFFSKEKKFIFNKFILFFIIYSFVEIVISVYRYSLSIISVFAVAKYIFIIMAYYIFSFYIRKKDKNKFVNIVMLFSLICSIVMLLQYFLYPKYGLFLNIMRYGFRFSSLRIYEGEGLINIGIVIAFGSLINKNFKFRVLPYLTFIIGLLEAIFVQKTRMVLLCIILTCVLVYLVKNIKRIGRLYLFILFLLIIIGIVQNTSLFSEYKSSFSTDDNSYTIRQAEIAFYLKQFSENMLFGMSFIPYNASSFTDMILRGPYDNYYRDDVGIIGFMNTFGLIGLVWFILMLGKVTRIIILSVQKKSINDNYETISFLLFVVFSLWTLIIMDPQRIIGFPILLALVDYLYFCNKNTDVSIINVQRSLSSTTGINNIKI